MLESLHDRAHHAGNLLEELDTNKPACLPGEPAGQVEHSSGSNNEVDFSQRIKDTAEELRCLRDVVYQLFTICFRAFEDIANLQIDGPSLLVNGIIHDVTKVLAPRANGLLEHWNATSNLGPGLDIEALKMELLHVNVILQTASYKQISGLAMEELLWKLQDSANSAGHLLSELDSFRIHDELHGTSDDTLAFDVHHTAKPPGSKLACLSACWPASTPQPAKLQHVSVRMKLIVEQLQRLRTEVSKIIRYCDHKTDQDIAQNRPITSDQNINQRLNGSYDLVNTIIFAVHKVQAPLVDGVLEAWLATNNIGLNFHALHKEMEEVWFMLECANLSQISGLAVEEMLHKIWDLADSAKYLLDELDYFRIHNLVLNARHASKAVAKLKCLPGGCMPKLGKLIPCSSSAHVHDDNSGQSTLCGVPCGGYAGAPVLRFNTVHFSERMSLIIEQLQPVRKDVKDLIESCGQRTVIDDQIRPITTPQTTEPKLYGRDHIMNTIIHDMTKGNYRDKRLTVLPVVGPGGIGKTTLIQHIYCNQEVKKHFPVMIWICVSASFNLNKVLEKIKDSIPEVGGEEESRSNGLIKQRFLLVLDDIWIISDADDWERLLLTLKTSQENGSMVVVTTRFPSISRMVGTTRRLIELEGLETEEFRKLFLKFVFGKEKCGRDHGYLLATGDEIVDKLNGSPLAANIVGRLLRNDLNLHHWKMVLQSKEWERQAAIDDLIPILKHSYVQRYVSCCALFPIDFRFSSSQIMNLWLGLDILPSGAQAFEYLNKLVAQGLFREEETNGCTCYVMSDLVHDLVLQVASHECLTLHRSNAGSVDIPSSIRHLSIIIDDDNAVSDESFKTELRKLKTRLKVRHLQTLMLFGEMDESFANIFGDLFRDANALRVLHLHDVSYHVESILHNFSTTYDTYF